MRVDYVLPRYGVEVVGGAEHAIRLIAERLVADPGLRWDVRVITTCALHGTDWANEYPPGTTTVNGVTVTRLPNALERHPDFDEFSNHVLLGPAPALDDQHRWIDMQGPFCPDLLNAVADSDADVLIFKPYLYYPTVRGVPLARGRALMHPAAHDEPALRLPLLRRTFNDCRGFVFNMHGERRLLESVWPETAAKPHLVSGFGIEPPPHDPAAARAAVNLDSDSPYLVSTGRVDKGKGSHLLASWFAAYKERRPGPLKLLLVGDPADPPPPSPDVVVTGRVDEDVKWGLLADADAVVQPSPYESLSLALLEGWAMARPAIVNGDCAATTDHCERSGGGIPVTSYASFEVAVDRLADSDLRSHLGKNGLAYLDRWYRWERIMPRYAAFIESFRAGAS